MSTRPALTEGQIRAVSRSLPCCQLFRAYHRFLSVSPDRHLSALVGVGTLPGLEESVDRVVVASSYRDLSSGHARTRRAACGERV